MQKADNILFGALGKAGMTSITLLEQAQIDQAGPVCPKSLGGSSFRAPATIRDNCSRDVHATVDFLGGGYDYTMVPGASAKDFPDFPNPEAVAQRLITAFRFPDKFGEWFYREVHPEARLKYGGRSQVQWFMSSQQSVMRWLGTATQFRVKRFFQDFRNTDATLDIEIKLQQGGSMVYGFEFKRNATYDTYLQQAPKMEWKIYKWYPVLQ